MLDPQTLILLAHSGATLAMCGVIWFVQVVHYPLFERVAAGPFVEYERLHTRRTSMIVTPLMLIEAATAAVLLLWWNALALAGVGILAAIWASTYFLQVPLHRQLEQGFDAAVHRRLVRTNWIRTVGWSARGAIALAMLPGAL